MVQLIKNLVFEGGGVKGIAYAGALEELENQGISLAQIENVAGTSIGAITALLLALNYNVKDIKKLLSTMDLVSLQDDSPGFVRDFYRLIKYYGFYQGNKIKNLIDQIIENKTQDKDITFEDLESLKKKYNFKNMYFVVTNLSTLNSEIFSYEHTPHLIISDAVYSSLAIPFMFPPIKINKNTKKKSGTDMSDFYIDGGLISNYPIKIFDYVQYLTDSSTHGATNIIKLKTEKLKNNSKIYNYQTLGLRLEDKSKINQFRNKNTSLIRNDIKNFKDYIFALVNTVLNSQQDFEYIESEDYLRTIYIDTLDINSNDFNISDENKQKLIESGKKAVRQFFLKSNYKEILPNDLLSACYSIILYVYLLFVTSNEGITLYHSISSILKEIVNALEGMQ